MNTVMMSPAETITTFLLWLLAIPLVMGICLRAPKLVVYGFLLVLFLFSANTWGQLEVETTIYSRGVGLFYFSLLNLFLFIAGVTALIRKLANPHNPLLAVPLGRYFLALLFLLCGHVILGLMSGVEILDILSDRGVINVLNMMIFMYMVVMAFNSERDKRNLLLTFMALAGARALFGLVRYVLFDGDPANPYRNFENLDIKIYFFDIADNYVAALAGFCAAWLLTQPGVRINLWKRLALYLYLALQVAAVALSFRRSSLGGMALMFAVLLIQLPSRRRLKFMLLALAAVSVAGVMFFEQRGQFNVDSGGFWNSLIYDIDDKNIYNSRFYELFAAAQSIGNNWLFGLGSWGSFTGDEDLLSYHFGKMDFVHSGFGHLILKTGVVGLLLFCAILFSCGAFYFRTRKTLTGNSRLMADAGFAGILFWIPTLVIGTPIIEFRTMLMFGLNLALPFVAAGTQAYALRANQMSMPLYAVA